MIASMASGVLGRARLLLGRPVRPTLSLLSQKAYAVRLIAGSLVGENSLSVSFVPARELIHAR